MIEEVASVVVIPVAGYLARKAARKGVAMMQARGREVPEWLLRYGPAVLGAAVGIGTAGATDDTSSVPEVS